MHSGTRSLNNTPPPTRRASTGQLPRAPTNQTASRPAPLPAPSDTPPAQVPVKPTGTKAPMSRYLRLCIDAETHTPCVEFTGAAARLSDKLKSALLGRLNHLDDPLHGWPAATTLIDLFSQFGVQPALGLTLIQDEALWGQLCAAKSNAGRGAALIAALLRLGETGVAFQWLSACPLAAERRRVVRRLLKDESQPLQKLKASDVRELVEAVFDDMLKKGRDTDEALRPAIDALRRQWRSERQEAPSLGAIEAALASQGVLIRRDADGQARLILEAGTPAGPQLTDLLLAHIAQALGHDDTRARARDVLFEALREFGLDCGNGRSVCLASQSQIERFLNQYRALAPIQAVALVVLIRRACTLLFATGDAAAVESLIRASLWLRDPLIRTEPLYQAAALQAMVDHGWAGLWLKTQAYNPWTVSTTHFPMLLDRLGQVASPGAALRFVMDALAFLADLKTSSAMSNDGPHAATWEKWRDDLLDGLVHAVEGLIKRSAHWPSVAGETLAQWAWVTGAVMELVRTGDDGHQPDAVDLLIFGPCLAHFHVLGEPFALTLKLLGCQISLAQTSHLSLERMRDLFKRCPIEIQSVVLHWPVGRLWAGVLWHAIEAREVLHKRQLSPAVQLLVLQDLLDDRKLLPDGLADVLSGLLAQAGFDRLVAVLQTRPEMTPQARQTLSALCDQASDAANWRPGLPALLRWLQATASQASADDTRALFDLLAKGILRLRATRNASDKDLLDIGAQLQLNTTPAMAAFQLDVLIDRIANPQIAAQVLRGWILHRIHRLRQTNAPLSPAERRLLKTVLARYGKLLLELDNSTRRRSLQDEWTYWNQVRKGMK
jgi:hypothetical protein